jgi:hypothetical protein
VTGGVLAVKDGMLHGAMPVAREIVERYGSVGTT